MRAKRPDTKNAQGLIEAAERKMDFTLGLEVTRESASTIVSNIYECFRMLGDALYVRMGIMDADHKEMIDELTALEVDTRRPAAAVRNLRQLRHNVNYYGYEPGLAETEDVRDLASACFSALAEAVKTKLR